MGISFVKVPLVRGKFAIIGYPIKHNYTCSLNLPKADTQPIFLWCPLMGMILSPPQRLQGSFGRGGVRWAKWVQAQIACGGSPVQPTLSSLAPALTLLSGSALTLHWTSAEERGNDSGKRTALLTDTFSIPEGVRLWESWLYYFF